MPPRMNGDNPLRIVNRNNDPEDCPSDIAKIARPIFWISINDDRVLNNALNVRASEVSSS